MIPQPNDALILPYIIVGVCGIIVGGIVLELSIRFLVDCLVRTSVGRGMIVKFIQKIENKFRKDDR